MFIKKISIKKFRLFEGLEEGSFNIPDGQNEGSGLNVFVGENGCGKTSLLDAIALPLLNYKAENFSIDDFFDLKSKTKIELYSDKEFDFRGVIPNKKKQNYKGEGFVFEAGVRQKDNKNYLSSMVVFDVKFIRAQNQDKPDDNSPDLRVNVNNPWSGPRFNENDVLFLDKNRTYQTRSGTYNQTRFDRLMEDFDYQYLSQEDRPVNFLENLKDISNGVSNEFLQKAILKFKEISGEDLHLAYLSNTQPHANAFFAVKKSNKQQIKLSNLGSGYEMIFSILYSFYLSQQSQKDLIILIDEPEIHLHPKLQQELVNLLLEFSKSAQIFISSHSPLLVKQLLENEKVKILVLKKENNVVQITPVRERKLPYLSANEVNYIAFGLATAEYHNELYEELKCRYDDVKGQTSGYKDFDNDFFVKEKNELKNSPWKGHENEVSIHTFIRNQIHHPKENNGMPNVRDLENSIKKMRNFL